LVEQRTFNPLVAGSNPARPTKFSNEIKDLQEIAGLFSLSVARILPDFLKMKLHFAGHQWKSRAATPACR
jgi:hypothetical protein